MDRRHGPCPTQIDDMDWIHRRRRVYIRVEIYTVYLVNGQKRRNRDFGYFQKTIIIAKNN